MSGRAGHQAELAERLASGPFVRLPPGRRHVHVPVTGSAETLAGLTLVVGSRRTTVAVQMASIASVRLGGPRALPGARVSWRPPMSGPVWTSLVGELVAAVGPVDAMAVYEQPQKERTGCALLLTLRGRHVAFVKLRRDAPALAREASILRRAASVPHPSFRTPTVLADGCVDGWAWTALTALPPRPHRPRRREPEGLAADVQAVLADLARPPGTPAHWVPCHGDLTPWNLRRTGDQVFLLDWEHASYGPPGADSVYYRAVLATVLRSTPDVVPPAHVEAVHHWLARVQARRATADDLVLTLELEAVLEQMLG